MACLFSSYDVHGLRLLSRVHSESMAILQKRLGRPFSDSEDADLSSRLVQNLSKAYDSGVREPSALQVGAIYRVRPPSASK
jgi:hypothetical protein